MLTKDINAKAPKVKVVEEHKLQTPEEIEDAERAMQAEKAKKRAEVEAKVAAMRAEQSARKAELD